MAEGDLFTVYIHTAPNGKKYVGITSKAVNKRWRNGKGYREHHQHLWSAICLYGWDNFTHEIVERNLTLREASLLEIKLIEQYDTRNREFGYNNSIGGECGSRGIRWSEDQKAKHSKALTGRVFSTEARANISKGLMGNKYTLGYHHTPEARLKMSKARKGNQYALGCKHTPENIERRAAAVRKPVTQYTKDGVEIAQFTSATDATKITGCNSGHISSCCTGKRKTAGGFVWAFTTFMKEEKDEPTYALEIIAK